MEDLDPSRISEVCLKLKNEKQLKNEKKDIQPRHLEWNRDRQSAAVEMNLYGPPTILQDNINLYKNKRMYMYDCRCYIICCMHLTINMTRTFTNIQLYAIICFYQEFNYLLPCILWYTCGLWPHLMET